MRSTHDVMCVVVVYMLAILAGAPRAVHAQGPRETRLYDSRNAAKKGHGHQGVTTNGTHWFVFDTAAIYRYENDDFSADQAKLAVKNETPLSHPDFKGTDINHLGAPTCWKGHVYTFAKWYKHGAVDQQPKAARLVWFSEKDLSCQGYLNFILPTPENGGVYVISGGPAIVGDHFYGPVVQTKDGKQVPVDKIAKFSLATGEFVGFLSLTRAYSKPQGLQFDPKGNMYVVLTNEGILKFDPSGKYQGILFRNGGRLTDIHEGIYFDAATNTLTMAVTEYREKIGGEQAYYILQADLGKDVYRYADAVKGNDWNTGYSPTDAKKTIREGMLSTVPGAVLRISGYARTSPARESVESGMAGWPDRSVVYEGHPEPVYITGSDDFSETAPDCMWKPSSTEGEYCLTTDTGRPKTEVEVRVMATAAAAAWDAQGMDGLKRRTKGKAGSLKGGEWDWADADNLGFKTLYYRPAEEEDIRTAHIEAGQRDCAVVLNKPFNVCRNIKAFLGNGGQDHRVTAQSSRFE